MDYKDVQSQLEEINEIFNTARTEDGWNLDEEMLFSYYFVDRDADKLEELGLFLEEKGYDFIAVFELGDEKTNEPTGEYLLHIDKVEIHTAESLAERNVEFRKLAEERGIEEYESWEFGEVGEYDEEEEEE